MTNDTDIDKLRATTSIADLSPQDAVHALGKLVNNAMEHHDTTSAQHAITLADTLPITTWPPAIRAYAYYTLANAHDELRRHEANTPDEAWSWSADFDASLLRLRQAANDDGFTKLPTTHQCQILTNLGSNLSTIGRSIEALEHWNHALKLDPTFSMARANRGYGLTHYANALYDQGHTAVFLWHAYHDLNDAIPGIPYADARRWFTHVRDKISKRYDHTALAKPPTFNPFSLGDTDDEIAYRTWAIKQRLFLNPLNDLTTESIAANDVLLTPSIVVKIDEPPLLQGFFNQLKQEYTSARFLLYQGLQHHAPRYADKDVKLWNTLDYPSYGTSLELIKLAYRSAYSLFDKIAYFLNTYLALGIKERDVNFQTLWYENQHRKQGLKPVFATLANLPLRGLYWLSRDLNKNEERQLASDAALLSTIRDHLEHKYLKAHEPEWVIAKGDPRRTDTLAYNIERATLEQKATRVMRLARAARIYLTLSIHSEERRRRKARGDAKVLGMPLHLYNDKWKT